MSIRGIIDKVQEEREQIADNWLKQLIKELPYRPGNEVLVPVLDIYRIIYENILEEQYQFRETSDDFLKRKAIAKRLAKLIDALDPREQPNEDEEFLKNMEIQQRAKDVLDTYQTMAIEAGLSGVNLGDNFSQALNNIQDIVNPPERRKEREGRKNI